MQKKPFFKANSKIVKDKTLFPPFMFHMPYSIFHIHLPPRQSTINSHQTTCPATARLTAPVKIQNRSVKPRASRVHGSGRVRGGAVSQEPASRSQTESS